MGHGGWNGTGYEDALYAAAVEEQQVKPAARKKKKSHKGIRTFAAMLTIAAAIGSAFGVGRVWPAPQMPAGNEAAADTETQANEAAADTEMQANEAAADTETQAYDSEEFAYVANMFISTNSSSVSAIFKSMKDAVVSIKVTAQVTNMFNRLQDISAAGSGIIFHEDAEKIYIVTNHHVIEGATQVTISLDDEITAPANLVGSNADADLAVISVKKAALAEAGIQSYKIASFADSDKVEVGDAAIAIGNAAGEGKSATLGIISAIRKQIGVNGLSLEVLQTDAAINPGNSGGALVNSKGEVVGINTAKLAETGVEGMGYAIPANVVSEIVAQIMSGTIEQRPYFGISGTMITEQYKRYYGFIANGLYVNSVENNTTAAAAGMRASDIIVSVNGVTVRSLEHLQEMESRMEIGAKVTFKIIRNNRMEMTLQTTMKEFPGRTSF